jgi:rhodanese-related sulfurtransferase
MQPEKLEKSKTYVAHCGSGYRAKIAWSFLKSQGFKAKAFPFPFETIFKSGKATKITL